MPEFTEVQKERVKESMDYFRNAFWHHSGEMRRIANFRAIADDPVFDGTKIKALTEMELGELSEAWQEMSV